MEREDELIFVDNVEHPVEGAKPNYEKLVRHLRAGQNCVAEERQTILPDFRKKIEARLKEDIPDLEIKFHYFEKDLVKAARNIISRPDDKKNRTEHLLTASFDYLVYEIPTDLDTIILEIEEPTEFPTT